MEPLTVALPKGRLLAPSAALFEQLGYYCPVDNGSRQLLVEEPGAELAFLLAKPADVPVYVEHGAADLGIAGQDVVREGGWDVVEPLQLGFGRCRLVVAGPKAWQRNGGYGNGSLRVATKYPHLATAYFRQRGISAQIVTLTGSIELAPCAGLADLVVDIVDTGRTLRENGLEEVEEIMACQTTVIVNRVAHRLRLAEIRRLLAALESACGGTT